MRNLFVYMTLPVMIFSFQATHVMAAPQPASIVSPIVTSAPIPNDLAANTPFQFQYTPQYGNWSLFLGRTIYSLVWTQKPQESVMMYITPHAHMITIDVIGKKQAYNGFRKHFIQWNIKNVNVTLNKVGDKKGWAKFSTTIYTQNIAKLITALQEASPMNLVLTPFETISIDMNGVQTALADMTQQIRTNNIEAPLPLAQTAPREDPPAPPDGMLPNLVPLYNQAQSYITQCLEMAGESNQQTSRQQVCLQRNELVDQLEKAGWCWGSGDPDEHDKDKQWHKCIFTHKAGIPTVEENVQKDFEKAKSMSKFNNSVQ